MNTYIQPGAIMTFVAPVGGVTSGTPVLIGGVLVVPAVTAAAAASFEGQIVGVFTLAKLSTDAWAAGGKVYWDNTNSRITTTAAGNTLVGVAAAAATNPSSTGSVRLDGVAR